MVRVAHRGLGARAIEMHYEISYPNGERIQVVYDDHIIDGEERLLDVPVKGWRGYITRATWSDDRPRTALRLERKPVAADGDPASKVCHDTLFNWLQHRD